jgi:16S rRNA (cytosine1402-N4)-methyltransferase
MKSSESHISILCDEVVSFFDGISLKTFFEGTLGAGGHAKAILQAHPEIERYIGCDKDPEAIAIARKTLEPWEDKVEFVQGDFGALDQILKEKQLNCVDGFFLTWECHRCN